MRPPKLWGGATPLGSTAVRKADQLGQLTSTFLGTEIREDGTLGNVMTKTCGAYAEVQRTGSDGSALREPFLSSGQDINTVLVDETLAAQARVFALGAEAPGLSYFFGPSTFVGDGLMVGFGATPFGPGATVYVILTHPGRPRTAFSPSAYLSAGAGQRSMSVVLGTTIEDTGDLFTLSLGWKNDTERYAFAVVGVDRVTINGQAVARPRIWLGSTGTMTLTKLPDGLGLDWTWEPLGARGNMLVGPACCTAPGCIEFLVYKPESDLVIDAVAATFGQVPVAYLYGPSAIDEVPADWAPSNSTLARAPLFPGNGVVGPFAQAADSPSYIGGGSYMEDVGCIGSVTLTARRPSTFIARSTDFGETWALVNVPALEYETTEPTADGGLPFTQSNTYFTETDAGSVGRVSIVRSMYDYNLSVAGITVRTYFTDSLGNTDEWTYTDYTNSLTRTSAVVPLSTLPVPRASANRGQTIPPGAPMRLVSAGSTTFAVMEAPAAVPPRQVLTTAGSGVDLIDVLNGVNAGDPDAHPYTYEDTVDDPYYCLRLYRRDDGSADEFVRNPWPGDDLVWTYGVDREESRPGHALNFDAERAVASQRLTCSPTWTSTGEGRIAFFFVRIRDAVPPGGVPVSNFDAPVTLVATTDNGISWVTRVIEGSRNFREFCVVDAGDEGKTILYVEALPDGRRQIRQISQDFTQVTAYGVPYSPQRDGLVNFKRYVHPGFPGAYDEPESSP